MRVLAVDTTTGRESVAVVEDDEVLAETRVRDVETHSRRLLPAIAFVLDQLGLSPAEIEGYAVTRGPGSFTGLRVGLSTVQGLALASGRPCLGLSALDVLAARIRGSAPRLVALTDAFRGDLFGAVYDAEARSLSEARAAAVESFLAEVSGPVAFIGDGAIRYRQRILEALPEALFPARSLFLAGTLGRLAGPRLAAGEGGGAGDLRPLYLRAPDIGGRKP